MTYYYSVSCSGLEPVGEDKPQLQFQLAGYSRKDVEVTFNEKTGLLSVVGESGERKYSWKERINTDYKVKKVTMKHGLLTVYFEKNIGEVKVIEVE